MEDLVSLLKSHYMFRTFSDSEIRQLANTTQQVHVGAKDFIFFKGDAIDFVYLVLQGSFKLQESLGEKTTHIFNFLGRDEFLGVAMAGLASPRYPTSAQSLEDSLLLKFPLSMFNELIAVNPEVRKIINRQISERFLEFQNDVVERPKLVPHRVAGLLLRLLEREAYGESRISLPLTRSDIGERVGAQTETVIRILSRWTKSGWIRTEEQRIEILNIRALRELAGKVEHSTLGYESVIR